MGFVSRPVILPESEHLSFEVYLSVNKRNRVQGSGWCWRIVSGSSVCESQKCPFSAFLCWDSFSDFLMS